MTFSNRLGQVRPRRGPVALGLCLICVATAAAQEQPRLYRLGYHTLKHDGVYDYQSSNALLNEAYRKAGVAFRQVWRSAIFGSMGHYVTVTPVTGMAQFDGPAPMSAMTEQQRAKYQAHVRAAVESARYALVQMVPELSVMSGKTTPPKFARVTTVRVLPGRQLEFEDAIRTTILPAMKKAGVADYWVHRTLLGGPVGEYTIVHVFEKWSELEPYLAMQKLYGAEYKAFLSKIAATAASAETMVAATVPELGYSLAQ